MMIERHETISKPEDQQLLWEFYAAIFQPINEETPFIQSFPKKEFMGWLTDPQAVKFVAKHEQSLVGLSMLISNIELEPLLSPSYFRKHFPDMNYLYCPVLAVAPNHRGTGVAMDLLRAMINEAPESTLLIFLHSKSRSLGLPRLFKLAGAGRVEGRELDAEVCWVEYWKGGKKAWPEDMHIQNLQLSKQPVRTG